MNALDEVMTLEEAAEKWGKSTDSLRQACILRNGKPPRFKIGIEARQSKRIWLVTRQGMERLYGELGGEKMYKVRNTNKTFNTVFKALEEAVEVLNNKSNSAQLAWCGTDKEVFREVTGEEPTVTLNEQSFILVDGDVFAIVQSDCTLEEANNALSDVADGVVIEEV